jgi:MerE protein
MLNRRSCALTPVRAETRGVAWVAGAFLICPCHLPLTLSLITTALAGTTAGLLVGAHWVAAGIIITLAWLAATWHGIQLMRRR